MKSVSVLASVAFNQEQRIQRNGKGVFFMHGMTDSPGCARLPE